MPHKNRTLYDNAANINTLRTSKWVYISLTISRVQRTVTDVNKLT